MNAGSDAAIPKRWAWPLAVLLLAFAGCDDDPATLDPGCGVAEALTLGQTLVADLGPGDPVLDGSWVDYYGVQVPRSGTLSVVMRSEVVAGAEDQAVDPFLYLWVLDFDDPIAQAFDTIRTGVVLTARIDLGVSTGCYRVGASGWPSASDGEYTIRADFNP